MKKKFIALSLSAAMALSLMSSFSVSALTMTDADENGLLSQDVTVNTEIQIPTISVEVPTTASVVVNPYQLGVTVDGSELQDQIINAEQSIVNASDVPVSIGATLSATPADDGKLVLATAPLKGTETTKSVFAYLEVAPKSAEAEAETGAYSDKFDTKAKNQIALSNKEVTKKDMITLGEDNSATTTGYFKIMGEAASAPAVPWNEKDTVAISLKFSITPVAATPADTEAP